MLRRRRDRSLRRVDEERWRSWPAAAAVAEDDDDVVLPAAAGSAKAFRRDLSGEVNETRRFRRGEEPPPSPSASPPPPSPLSVPLRPPPSACGLSYLSLRLILLRESVMVEWED